MRKTDVVLINVKNKTTKGTFYGAEIDTSNYKSATYVLKASLTETGGSDAVTLDVKIQSYFPITNEWRDVVIFDQLSVTGDTTESVQTKIATAGIGMKQRVVYTIGGAGAVGDCDLVVEGLYD